MLTVVCWRWQPRPNYRIRFPVSAVGTLRDAIAKHYPHPHRFICVTNEPEGIAKGVEIVDDTEEWADVPPQAMSGPSCYRRLRLFAPGAGSTFGERFVSLDLDVMITGDLSPLWNRPEPFVAMRDPMYPNQINGSMFLLTAGAHPHVWSRFDPKTSPRIAAERGLRGSDQAWISYCIPTSPATTWGPEHGVYSYRRHLQMGRRSPPPDARVIVYHGPIKPWDLQP